MPNSNLIFLVGMPGAGKSYWGRAWSEQHHWSFLDLDNQVEALADVSIPQIFASVGEEGFRAIEAHALVQSISGAGALNTIIATGGGTPMYGDNMELMLQSGCVAYLSARTKTLLSHLTGSHINRPLLAELSPEKLEALLEERIAFYQQAHYKVEVEKITESTFAQIQKACSNRPS
jgi:shikimate kinase